MAFTKNRRYRNQMFTGIIKALKIILFMEFCRTYYVFNSTTFYQQKVRRTRKSPKMGIPSFPPYPSNAGKQENQMKQYNIKISHKVTKIYPRLKLF